MSPSNPFSPNLHFRNARADPAWINTEDGMQTMRAHFTYIDARNLHRNGLCIMNISYIAHIVFVQPRCSLSIAYL